MDDSYLILYQNNHPSLIQNLNLQQLEEQGFYADDDPCIEINISRSFEYYPIVIATVSVIVGACGAIWIYLAIKKYLCKSKQSSFHLRAPQNQGPAINNTIYVSIPMS